MLNEGDVIATVAVKDVDAAKQFYGGTLGLKLADETPAGLMYESGSTKLLVYPSEFAGSNKATYAGWRVTDVEGTVAELKGKGVKFEQYDNLPGTTREGDIHSMDQWKGAWFKDPDGNIFALGNM